ncbi:MAG: HAMP domain-containing sensor histidine kinase [Acholeplasmataceae bacterium]
MKKPKLMTQLNLLFSMITLISAFGFLLFLMVVVNRYRADENKNQLAAYYHHVKSNIDGANPSQYNGYIYYRNGTPITIYNMQIMDYGLTVKQVHESFNRSFLNQHSINENLRLNRQEYYFLGEKWTDGSNEYLLIVFTGETYLKIFSNYFNYVLFFSLIGIVVLGNLVILFWSRITVERIKRLQGEVSELSIHQYTKPIEIDGKDEITDLARTVEKMRQEIADNEKIKQEMLQNISHDFKTPIAVIKSYAEAISDGVGEGNESDVIIKQAEMLNQKVKQLLELNKLEYLKRTEDFEDVRVKDVIENIVDNQKYRTNIEFILDLDQSQYYGVKDNFYTAFSNIIDNAIRYAKTKIVITLKQRKLTFFNDGEHIAERFTKEAFKPYEKGQKGQFGLGMSIVQKTLNHFNLSIKVENIEDGVLFIIEPL